MFMGPTVINLFVHHTYTNCLHGQISNFLVESNTIRRDFMKSLINPKGNVMFENISVHRLFDEGLDSAGLNSGLY